ncbi:MAG: tRNA (uridine(54)-C5)-methyltransferase TrmA [Campylobacterota bacterium]|nr:tRNA (uridine(54)-C5)-methyltransferase TrmA [Campylobacterota bacterium]
MNCDYFGKCGSCTLGTMSYDEQLDLKVQKELERFKDFYAEAFDIVRSDDGAFRNRAEFRIWRTYDEHNNAKLNYAMNDMNKKALPIESCSIVSPHIATLMPELLEAIAQEDKLSFKLFTVEFLSSTTADMLITLIYHRKLDDAWTLKAKQLEERFKVKIIGRSRKQKVICSDDHIDEVLSINDQEFKFVYKEGGFTQPNQKVNVQMIQWVINNSKHGDDLCELYCGGGNFTLPLSTKFDKVLATEISKTSIKSAKENCTLNEIDNIEFIRMSSEEFVQARQGVREFRRMAEVDLSTYNFSTIFVDPPRAGLDDTTRTLAQEFDQIIYISCNPETLHRDLEVLMQTHAIENFALFDQFAYSRHIESGVVLKRKI